ncbi:Gfo/Idh/MocA family oxidoreductase [Amycolatopsis sp. NPDC049868]|uniref:Gfo/Idh/MocA family oxidoreductase n=1 Tax=Amycolatopsis sp. NPDC049868 TaxID=3363934 RepID=UPI0037B78D5A
MKPVKVVVAGDAINPIHLDAVLSAQDSFRLAGIVATGTDFSHDLSRRYQVPLYPDADLAPDVDIACVVVRADFAGGVRSELARAFLRRGIHVLQEHPVHGNEVARNLRMARKSRAVYAVNTRYLDVAPVRRFLAAVEVLRRTQRLRFIDAACSASVAYPLIDTLARAAGSVRPYSFEALPADASGQQPFRSLHAVIGGVPVTLRIQNQLDPEDSDSHAFLLHRIAVGCDAGVLALADTHGPVLWNPRLHADRDSIGRMVLAGPGAERLTAPSTILLGPEPGSHRDVFARLWPDALVTALHRVRAEIADPAGRIRSGQWTQGIADAWTELTARLGIPDHIRPEAPPVVPVADLVEAVERTAP